MKSGVLFVCATLVLTSGCTAGDGIGEGIGLGLTNSGSNNAPTIPATLESTSSNTIAASTLNTIAAPFQAGDTTVTYYVPSATTQVLGNTGTTNPGGIATIAAENTITIASDAADNISSIKFNISTGGISFTSTISGSSLTSESSALPGVPSLAVASTSATAGPNDVGAVAQALSYSGWGVWASIPATGVEYGGAFAFGIGTAPSAVPTTGSATYSGYTGGAGSNGPNSGFTFGGVAQVTANFSSETVSTIFSSLVEASTSTGVETSIPNITGSATISGNQYSGTVAGGGLSGTLNGAFYGPSAQETAGTYRAQTGSTVLVGGFAAK